MPCGISVLKRIVVYIGEPVQTLRILGIGYNRVGLEPPVKRRRVEARDSSASRLRPAEVAQDDGQKDARVRREDQSRVRLRKFGGRQANGVPARDHRGKRPLIIHARIDLFGGIQGNG